MVTRRAAAKRAAEGDQENASTTNMVAKEIPTVPQKQAALQVKATKRNALGDKNVNQTTKLPAAGKNLKAAAAKVPGGRVAIPARPAVKVKAPAAAPPAAQQPATRAAAVKAAKAGNTSRTIVAAKVLEPTKRGNEKPAQEEVVETSEEIVATTVVTAQERQVYVNAAVDIKTKTAAKKTTNKVTTTVAKKLKPASSVAEGKQAVCKAEHERDQSTARSDTSPERSLMDFDEGLPVNLSEEERRFIEEQRKEDASEPSLVHEYSDEIFQYMRELEERMMPDPCYMDNQSEIQWEMRAVLIDWLVQVHGRFQMQNETLFLCVNFIDRFLSAKVVSVQKFQLVGITALLLAAKFEEICAPSIADLVYMVDNGYDAEEIKKAERYMVQLLNFELGYPGPMSFLRRVSKADDYCQSTRTLAKYLIELTIMDEKFIGIPPSMIAAASDMLARKFLKGSNGEWTAVHVHYSGYTFKELEDVAARIIERAMDQQNHQSIFDKYADARYWKASIYVQQWFEKYGYPEEFFFPSSGN